MKLIRYGKAGSEKPGLVDAYGLIRDLSSVIGDIGGEALTGRGLGALRRIDPGLLARVREPVRLGPPIAKVGKIVCVGLNYADHAAESNLPVPEQPVLFMKATTAICGPCDEVLIPPGSTQTDWEIELGVVIGDVARRVSPAQALQHVAGYVVVNDISERAYQLEHGGQWVKGKSCDTFAPLGPWLVTREEIADPNDLKMWLTLNDKPMQNGSTATMVFRVAHLVSYISQYMTLEPGDLISTGTPPGVGLGQKPPRYLEAGDVMELGIEGLGVQRQRVARAD